MIMASMVEKTVRTSDLGYHC